MTNNLKLFRCDVVTRLRLTATGFAVNAETGLQPILMGYPVVEVPISSINRSIDMGASWFRLFRVGGGYARVLMDFLRARAFGRGPYAALRGTARGEMELKQGAADSAPTNQG